VAGREAPSVVCIEWIEPLMTAGHWMPGLVELAGGRALLAEGGAPSPYVAWDDIVAADPDVLAVTACGFSVEQSLRDLGYLTERPEWSELRAVREGRVFVLDGNAYFNRPGPRLYRSVELLAAVLHPDRAGIHPEPWEVVQVGAEQADTLAP
jgi:iron complex transport system substrate-binding protein